ncbi:GtrA family protein [Plantibacter sp. 2H11-2]|uniref:GtrA family protein n=1 Tax=Plantibacter sp. 2H11-2 TaxID=3414431 RepID=UPI003CE7D0B9
MTTPPPGRLRKLVWNSGVRYLLVGGSAFLVDLGLLALFYTVLGWPLPVATVVAFLLSFVYTYSMQRVFAFGSQAPQGGALVKYAILVVFNTIATAAIVSLIDTTFAGWIGGKVVATVATTIWNYFAYRYWVFAHRPDTPAGPAGLQEE